MKTRTLWRLAAVVLVALLIAASSGPALAALAVPDPGPKYGAPPIGGEEDVARFVDALQVQGFKVQKSQEQLGEGMVRLDVTCTCCAQGWQWSCYNNNAGAPYKVAIVPQSPDQKYPSYTNFEFLLAPNEALIIVGQTPPPMSYFSYQPFVLDRWSEKKQELISPFGTLGDTVNNLTIRTSGPPGDPFNKDAIVVITSDRAVDARVTAAARRAGYPASILNTLVVPRALTRLGFGEHADQFIVIQRLYRPVPGYEQAMEDYMNKAQVMLRVALPVPPEQLDPYPVPKLRVRGTGQTELDLMPAVDDLREAILNEYAGLEHQELTTGVWLTDGSDGLQREVAEYGPARDTVYLWTEQMFTLGPDDFVVVYGANHEATGKATYSNAGVYVNKDAEDVDLLLGIVGQQSAQFKGTANDWLEGKPEADKADKLYVWKFARNCGNDTHCTTVTSDCARVNLDLESNLWIGWRAYLEPSTKVGPAFTEIVYDQAIVFRGE